MSVNAVDKTTGNTTPLAGNVNDKVGNLASLTTSTKSTAVAAINELNSTKQAKTDSGLTTDAKTIVGAINELKSGLTNATTINNATIGNFLFSKVGHVVMILMANGVITTDSDGFILLDGEPLIIPVAYRPISTINIVESYADKRISIDINGKIFLPNDLSAESLVVRFEAVYLAN